MRALQERGVSIELAFEPILPWPLDALHVIGAAAAVAADPTRRDAPLATRNYEATISTPFQTEHLGGEELLAGLKFTPSLPYWLQLPEVRPSH